MSSATTEIAQIKPSEMTQDMAHLRDFFHQQAHQLLAAMPPTMSKERFIAVCLNEFRANKRLMECNPLTIISCIQEAANLGLEINGCLGHAYLVPYGDECVLIAGYKGLIDLARRSGQISTITLECVYEGDEFAFALGDDGFIKHRPNESADADFSHEKITHAYCVVQLKDGGVQRKVWNRAKLNQHRDQYSQAFRMAEKKGKDSPWHTNYDVMAKKTVIRDMIGRGELPVSPIVTELAVREERVTQSVEARGVSSHTVIGSLEQLTDHLGGTESSDTEPAAGPERKSDEWWSEFNEKLAKCRRIKDVDELAESIAPPVHEDDLLQIEVAAKEQKDLIRAGKLPRPGED